MIIYKQFWFSIFVRKESIDFVHLINRKKDRKIQFIKSFKNKIKIMIIYILSVLRFNFN